VFIIKQRSQFIAIQACHALTLKTDTREIEGLKVGIKSARAERGIIITYNQTQMLDDNLEAIPFRQDFFDQE